MENVISEIDANAGLTLMAMALEGGGLSARLRKSHRSCGQEWPVPGGRSRWSTGMKQVETLGNTRCTVMSYQKNMEDISVQGVPIKMLHKYVILGAYRYLFSLIIILGNVM